MDYGQHWITNFNTQTAGYNVFSLLQGQSSGRMFSLPRPCLMTPPSVLWGFTRTMVTRSTLPPQTSFKPSHLGGKPSMSRASFMRVGSVIPFVTSSKKKIWLRKPVFSVGLLIGSVLGKNLHPNQNASCHERHSCVQSTQVQHLPVWANFWSRRKVLTIFWPGKLSLTKLKIGLERRAKCQVVIFILQFDSFLSQTEF